MDDKQGQPIHTSSDDMEESPKDNDGSFQEMEEESDKTPTTGEIQVIDSVGRDSSENQQSPSGKSEETPSQSFVSISASPSQARDDILPSPQNIVPSVGALLSPQQLPAGCEDPFPVGVAKAFLKALDRQETPTCSPKKLSVETGSGPTSAKKRRAASPLSDSEESETTKESCRSEASRNLSESTAGVQILNVREATLESPALESPTRSLTRSTTKKRKLSESSSSDSESSNDALKSNSSVPISVVDSDLASLTGIQREVTVGNPVESACSTEEKTTISFYDCSIESNSPEKQYNPDNLGQSNLGESATEEDVYVCTTDSNSEKQSNPDSLRQSNLVESASEEDVYACTTDSNSPEKQYNPNSLRQSNLGESVTEEKTIFLRDSSVDSDSVVSHSNSEDWNPTKKFSILSRYEHETAVHSNTSSDVSSDSPDKYSGKEKRKLSDSGTWRVVPSPEKSGPLKLARIPTSEVSSSNLVPTSNPQKSTPEYFEPCIEAKIQKPRSVSSEETRLNMAHSGTDVQMLESSQYGPVIENPDFLPSRTEDPNLEIGRPGFENPASNRGFPNPHVPLSSHLPEHGESFDINVPQMMSNKAHSGTYVQMLESSQNRPVIENPDFSSSRTEAPNLEIGMPGFENPASNRGFPNPHVPLSSRLPENSESFEVNFPQSASNMTPSATNIQMSEYSRDRPVIENTNFPSSRTESSNLGIDWRELANFSSNLIFSNPFVPSSSHLPAQGVSSDFNVPRPESEFQTGFESDRSQSDSSTRTFNPYEKSKPLSKESVITESAEMLLRRVKLLENQDPNIRKRENLSAPLQDSRSTPSGDATAREPSDGEMELDPPYLDIREGQGSTSSHQPVVTDGSSAGDRFNSSKDNAETGGTRRDTSPNRIPKCASTAQTLLLTILEEMMKFNGEKDLFLIFRKLFRIVSKYECQETKTVVNLQMTIYLEMKRRAWSCQNAFKSHEITFEYHIQNAYEDLLFIVVTILPSTLPMWEKKCETLNFYRIMSSYTTFKSLYENASKFWGHIKVEDIKDGASKYRVTYLMKIMPRLFLQLRNAFRELLFHIGEYATQENIDRYEKHLFEEDKRYLKRQI